MNFNRFSTIAAASVAGLTLAAAAPAAADTFCVHQGTGCAPGAADHGADLAGAIAAAKAHAGPDEVVVGAGTYVAPATGFVVGDGELHLRGAGPGTVLSQGADGDGSGVISVHGGELSDVAVVVGALSNARGIYAVNADVHDVTVSGDTSNGYGAYLVGATVLRDSVVDMADGTSATAVTAHGYQGASPRIADSALEARTGLYAQTNGDPAPVVAERLRIVAQKGVYANAATVEVRDTLIEAVTNNTAVEPAATAWATRRSRCAA